MEPGNKNFGSAILSSHAVREMARRGISEADVRAVLAEPGQQRVVRPSRVVLASLLARDATGGGFVLRVFVDIDRSPPVVVTVYRSSKIGKYWSQP